MIREKSDSLVLTQSSDISYSVSFPKRIFNTKLDPNKGLQKLCKNKKSLIVIDKNVNKIYGKKIKKYFNSINGDFFFKEIDDSEASKNFKSVENLCAHAKKVGLGRNAMFIAIGGGVTMDIVGFSAFIYRRKIPYIKIPTTLVGIVDAGVGVKTGINFNNSKNFLGGYYAPIAVFNDQGFLKTLDSKEIRSGLYEILKMAIIADKALFKSIEENYILFLKRDFNNITDKIIKTSSLLIMKELENNLFESRLKRSVDFGHTFSPFLETYSKFIIPHGQAVGIDILISSFISFKKGNINAKELKRISSLVKNINFSEKYIIPNARLLFKSLNEIKGHRAGNLNLVLPLGIGVHTFTNKCSQSEINHALEFLSSTDLLKK